MLDQNTDRMLHLIGVFMAAVGIIIAVMTFMPDFVSGIVSGADGYDIEYNLNDGSSMMQKRHLGVKGEHIVPLEEPELEDYHFGGWLAVDTATFNANEQDPEAFSADDGDIYLPSSEFTPRSDTTMIAQWNVRQHDIHYDTNDGEGDFPSEKVDYYSDYTLYEDMPTRVGHTFEGWLHSETLTSFQPGDTITPEGDVTFTAQWSLDEYDVAYDLNGGSGNFTDTVISHGHTFDISSVTPTRAGYTFTGWEDNAGTIHQPSDAIDITSPTTLTAKWSINSYDVRYDVNGGDGSYEQATIDYLESHTINETAPTRTGYTFAGWVSSIDGETYQPGESVEISEPEDLVLKADWSINSYNVTHDLNNGTGNFSDASIQYNSNYTIPDNAPTRVGYTFEGWVNSNTDDVHRAGASINIQEDTILTAQWSVNSYTVSYDLNGGGGTFVNHTLNYNSTYSILSHTPSRAGHTFVGWLNSSDGNVYDADDSFTITENTTLTAQWTVNDYSVQYDTNGGKGYSERFTLPYGTKHTITSRTPTRQGHSFIGWRRSDNNKVVTAGDSLIVSTNTKLVAQWRVHEFDVTYDLNGGSGSLPTSTHDFGSTYTVNSTIPSRTGYSFDGWTRSDNGDLVVGGDTLSIAGALTLTAQWTPDTYTIRFNANGGSGQPSNQTKTYGQNINLSKKTPSRSGYRFTGWSVNQNGSGTVYQPGDSYSREGNETLYAQWVERVRYRLYLGSMKQSGYQESNSYGFGGVSGFNLVKGTDYVWETRGYVNQRAVNDGKTFASYLYVAGWGHPSAINKHRTTSSNYVTRQYTAPVSGAYRTSGYLHPSGGSRSGRAVWQNANLFLQHPDRNNGTSSGSSNGDTYVDKGTTIRLPEPDMSKKDYTFAGWKNGSSVYQPGDPVTITAPDVRTQFTAQWEPKSYNIRYSSGSGSGGPNNTSAKYGSTFRINKSSIPRLNNHVFAGWRNNQNDKVYNPNSTFTVNGPTTLTARFRGDGYLKVGSKIKIRSGAKYVSNAVGERGKTIPDSHTIHRVSYVQNLGSHGSNSVTFGDSMGSNATGAVHINDVILQDPDVNAVQVFSLRAPMTLANEPMTVFEPQLYNVTAPLENE